MSTKTLTLTHYEHPAPKTGQVIRTDVEPGTATFYGRQVEDTVTKVETTYQVGDVVEVDAFARWRPGIVTSLGRTRVTVEYRRNQQGTKAERSFTPREVRLMVGVRAVLEQRVTRTQV